MQTPCEPDGTVPEPANESDLQQDDDKQPEAPVSEVAMRLSLLGKLIIPPAPR